MSHELGRPRCLEAWFPGSGCLGALIPGSERKGHWRPDFRALGKKGAQRPGLLLVRKQQDGAQTPGSLVSPAHLWPPFLSDPVDSQRTSMDMELG